MSETYGGSTIEVVDALPATNDQAGFEALAWVSGACALHSVPAVARTWERVAEDLVCQSTSFDKKGGARWDDVTFPLSRLPNDAAQAIYEALEDDVSRAGSFKLAISESKAGVIYFTAQVSKFALADGGTRNTIHTSTVQLLLQSIPVFVAPVAA